MQELPVDDCAQDPFVLSIKSYEVKLTDHLPLVTGRQGLSLSPVDVEFREPEREREQDLQVWVCVMCMRP